jgi:carbamate kinase
MRVVAALGGNALLRRGEPMTAAAQRDNVRRAAAALAPIAAEHELIVTHGNGPQVGLLALQAAALADVEPYPFDILGAESEGMIGYLIEQALTNALPEGRPVATLLTQVLVDPDDRAFSHPDKPIGPCYSKDQAMDLQARVGWHIAPDGDRFRRVVPSPAPQKILEVGIIEMLLEHGAVVICAGGGGIPVVRRPDGALTGVEAVIDKDRVSALLATAVGAGCLLLLTDVDAVQLHWMAPSARPIRSASPQALRALEFAAGSMGPKIEAGCDFAEDTDGFTGIGRLDDASAILEGAAGTRIGAGFAGIETG